MLNVSLFASPASKTNEHGQTRPFGTPESIDSLCAWQDRTLATPTKLSPLGVKPDLPREAILVHGRPSEAEVVVLSFKFPKRGSVASRMETGSSSR